MRLEAQKKMGFYPAPPNAIEALLKHLVIENKDVRIIDPCAGCGRAIKQIGEGLGIAQDQSYAIELCPVRGHIAKHESPSANVLSPCSFFSASITPQSFGLVYCNPPFDDELGGGGREELAFARASYRLLCTGGVFVLVAPYKTMRSTDMVAMLDQHFRDGYVYRFPELKFNECVFIGLKRSMPIVAERATKEGALTRDMQLGYWRSPFQQASDCDSLGRPARIWDDGENVLCETRPRQWVIPSTWKPARFLKAGYTDEELLAAINNSPLNRLAMGTVEPAIKEPPLPLARGHVAMLLASGALDGLVETPQGNHVVRGVSSKTEVYNEEASETSMSDDGKTMKTKDVYSEKICLKVRAVDSSGTIYTFTTDGAVVMDDPLTQEDFSYADWQMFKKLSARIDPKNNCTPAERDQATRQIEKLKIQVRKAKGMRKTGT